MIGGKLPCMHIINVLHNIVNKVDLYVLEEILDVKLWVNCVLDILGSSR